MGQLLQRSLRHKAIEEILICEIDEEVIDLSNKLFKENK